MKTTIETLKKGDTLLVSVRKTANGSFQAEFAEHIINPDSPKNMLASLNKGDERFEQTGKPRRCWTKITPESASELGIDLIKDKVDEEGKEYNILNPSIDGVRIRIQVTETTEATEWQAKNVEKAAKQIVDRKTGEVLYFRKDGKFIFSNTSVVSDVNHTFLKGELYPFNHTFAETANVPFEMETA